MIKDSHRRITLAVAVALMANGLVAAVPAQAQVQVPAQAQVPAASGSVAVPTFMPRAATVEQALSSFRDIEAVIEGYIVNRLRHEHYTFRDTSGKTIEIELDDKYLPPGREINDKTRVRIFGEVDTHRFKPNDIDVKHIIIIE